MKVGFFCEADGSLSMRRLLAAWFALLAPVAFGAAFFFAAIGWWVFLPGGAFTLAALFCVFFTTWSDVVEVIKAAVGKSPSATQGVPQ